MSNIKNLLKKSVSIFARRLREARLLAGLTQEQLAIRAGIDEFSASARMSQYENGKHFPKYEIAQRLAVVLKVPVEYLYAVDDKTAKLLLCWNRLSRSGQKKALEYLEQMGSADEDVS